MSELPSPPSLLGSAAQPRPSTESPDSSEQLVDAVACLDFGSLHSKEAVAYWSNGAPQLLCIQFDGTLDDPDRPEDANGQFEFVAAGTVDPENNDELVEGKRALLFDQCFPLKTMLVHLALARDAVTLRLPWGSSLISALKERQIMDRQMRRLLAMHLKRLHRYVIAATRPRRLRIGTLVLTYPNYLIPNEGGRDFDLYIDILLELALPVWGDVKVRIMSEGQSAALYVCIPCYDVLRGMERRELEAMFKGLNKKSWVNLIMIDIGSSTLNLETLCAWFDEHGRVKYSQTFVRPGQATGVQSGSHLANDKFRKIAIRELAEAERTGKIQVRPGDLAKALLSFDRKKRAKDFDYGENIENERTLTFRIDDDMDFRIDCTPAEQVAIFGAAFNPAYREVKRAVKILLQGRDRANDSAILFGGGSCVGKGIRRDLRDMMENFEADAREAGTKVNFEFMGNLNPIYWSTAVSAGGCLGVLTQPPLAQILNGFTIGLQEFSKRGNEWQGHNVAKVLFSEGCTTRRGVDIMRTRNRRFRLVADPSYQTGRDRKRISRKFPMIEIEPARSIDGNENPLPPYDLGAELDGMELPNGRVRCMLEGQCLQHLAEGNIARAIEDDSLPIVLSFFSVDGRGRKKRHMQDRKYVLWIKSDAKKFPIVAQEYDFKKFELPFWCRTCDEEIATQTALVCRDCVYGVCQDCASGAVQWPDLHTPDHKVEVVKMSY